MIRSLGLCNENSIVYLLDYLIMYSSSNSTLKLLNCLQPNVRKTIVRTLLNPFGSKTVETAKDAHSNLLTDTKCVFELQQHTVPPKSMVNDHLLIEEEIVSDDDYS